MYNINSLFTARKSRSQYQIERSLRFNSADSAYLNRTFVQGNQKTFTWSGWVKRSSFGALQFLFQASNDAGIAFQSDNTLEFNIRPATTNYRIITTQVFRDPSAWYHIVCACDTTLATADDRLRMWINGTQVTAFGTRSNPVQNLDGGINNASTHYLGRYYASSNYHYNGYLTECHFINGYAYDSSYFGETDTPTGVWKPKKYAGTYGTNGFYLKFADNSGTTAATLGKDSSGNGNNWTPNNFSVTAGAGNDSLIDSCTSYADGGNGRGNYCTLNPLSKGDDATLSNGNLDVAYGSSNFPSNTMATFGMSSGKWYWETTITASSLAATGAMLGITNNSNSSYNVMPQYPGYNTNGWGYHGNNGFKYNNASGASYGNTYGVNDVIGCAFDADTGKIWWSKNGTWQASGDPAAGTNAAYTGLAAATYFPAAGDGSASATYTASYNFGQRAFAYTPPSGFKALNTQNLPEPSIKKPSSYFDTVLWTGNGTSGRVITSNVETVDLAWVKIRSSADDHRLANTVTGGNKHLKSNTTEAESTGTNIIQSFSGNTFTIGSDNSVNANTSTYVGWTWKESATSGFDIVTYTGNGTARTIAHSLGVAPSMIIVKNRSNGTANWQTGSAYHNATSPWNYYMRLNTTGAAVAASTIWNNTAPTSSVFSIGTDTEVNANGDNYVAYLWSEVAGFSKFGSYTGGGGTDGPFVFCGFRPRWIIFKSSTLTNTDWMMFDAVRNPHNVMNLRLDANSNAQEATSSSTDYVFDLLSNGFKIRGTNNNFNNTGSTYIFAAYAESPFKFALAR